MYSRLFTCYCTAAGTSAIYMFHVVGEERFTLSDNWKCFFLQCNLLVRWTFTKYVIDTGFCQRVDLMVTNLKVAYLFERACSKSDNIWTSNNFVIISSNLIIWQRTWTVICFRKTMRSKWRNKCKILLGDR